MQILKLALPLAGLLMATQALAHKASHATATPAAPLRLAPAQTDTNPAALLNGIGGRNAPGAMEAPALTPPEPSIKSSTTGARNNRLH